MITLADGMADHVYKSATEAQSGVEIDAFAPRTWCSLTVFACATTDIRNKVEFAYHVILAAAATSILVLQATSGTATLAYSTGTLTTVHRVFTGTEFTVLPLSTLSSVILATPGTANVVLNLLTLSAQQASTGTARPAPTWSIHLSAPWATVGTHLLSAVFFKPSRQLVLQASIGMETNVCQ